MSARIAMPALPNDASGFEVVADSELAPLDIAAAHKLLDKLHKSAIASLRETREVVEMNELLDRTFGGCTSDCDPSVRDYREAAGYLWGDTPAWPLHVTAFFIAQFEVCVCCDQRVAWPDRCSCDSEAERGAA